MGRKSWHLTWKTVEVQGRPASYGEVGEGTPLVFLHGWALRESTYRRALGHLARRGIRVLAPSLPGFGGTAGLSHHDTTIAGYARWVVDFCRAVGLDPGVYVVGHSFGGGVGIRLAHDHPEWADLLVLVNSVGGAVWRRDGDGEHRPLANRPLWDWGLHLPYDLLRRSDEARKVLPVVLPDATRNLVRNPRGFLRAMNLARQADLRPELETLRRRGVPVVILWGSEDKLLPAESLDGLVDALGGEPQVVSGSHGWLIADPECFAELMTNVVQVVEHARHHEPPFEPRRHRVARLSRRSPRHRDPV